MELPGAAATSELAKVQKSGYRCIVYSHKSGTAPTKHA